MPEPPMHENPYAPPLEVRRAQASAEAEAMYTAHRARARMLRAVAVLHLLFALYLTTLGIVGLVGGIASWRSSTDDLREYAHPDLVAARYRRDAFVAFAISFGGFSLGALNVAIGFGLWRFRRWPARLTVIQAYLLVALALLFGACTIYWWGEYSYGVGSLLFVLPIMLLSNFVRSRKSSMVCSQAYRDALVEVKGARG
jgi:F0F1-type ATP synthase assembly protein I